jgi:hypothetical protein
MEIQMQAVNSKSFINMLSEEKPVVCFFHRQKEDAQVPVVREILTKLEKELPLLPVYEFITDESPENKQLCDIVEIVDKPVLVIYKNGNFSRYKDKQLNEKSIAQFLGNKVIYMPKEPNKSQIEVDVD